MAKERRKMYESHWGLTEKPFQNTFNPRFFYYTPQHKDAFMKLTYCIQDSMGAGLLTGIFGCGKTFIAQTIISQLNPERFKIVFISHPPPTSLGLLISICSELGDKEILLKAKETPFAESIVWSSLKNQISNNHLNGKDTAIIIDEAHIINDINVFETIRLLLNLQEKDKFLITLILIGQPELAEKIENLKPLEQRIAVKSRIGSLNQEETGNYISHRLKIAGRTEPIFTKEAIGFIYESTGGIPRRINRLCDLALLSGFIHKVNKIDLGILQAQAMGVEDKATGKPEESAITVSSIFIPQVPKLETKDTEQIYNQGLLLAENLLNRVEKKEPLDIKLIVSIVSSLIERLKLQDTTLLILTYKTNTQDYLCNHLLGVCIFSLAIGLELGLTEESLVGLGLSAILHDLGMVNFRQIIQQPRRLTPEEYESVKTHPVLTVEFLEKFNKDITETAKLTILSHHERINGQGYPKGLKKEEIPLEARILAVVDVWEALTHKRPWRDRLIPYEAMIMMRDFSESLFDSGIVKALVDKLSIYPIGSLVRLNTNEIGEITSAEKGFPKQINIIFDSREKRLHTRRHLDEPKLIELSSYPDLYIAHHVAEKEIE
jgi:general secretion pathway protein A